MKRIFKRVVACAASLAIVSVSSLSISVQAGFIKHQLPNYPLYQQDAENCWLYAISSMARYSLPGFCCKEQVIGAHINANNTTYDPNRGANVLQAKNIIDYLFTDYSPVLHYDSLSQNEIIAQYSCNVPAYINGIRYDTNEGEYIAHAVALMGYKKSTIDNNVYMIYYMNPQNCAIEYYGYAEGLENKFSNNITGVTYNWEHTITLI